MQESALTFVSFDPCMYNRHFRLGLDRANLDLCDLNLTLGALCNVGGPTVIQLSTYDTQDGNPQGAVIASVNSALFRGGFALAAVVRVDGSMMSLVYARNVEWSGDLAGLPGRFDFGTK